VSSGCCFNVHAWWAMALVARVANAIESDDVVIDFVMGMDDLWLTPL
jgi:hypothetical protein